VVVRFAGVPTAPSEDLAPSACAAAVVPEPTGEDIARSLRGRQSPSTRRMYELRVSAFLKWLGKQPIESDAPLESDDVLSRIQSPTEFLQWTDRFFRSIGGGATLSSLKSTRSALNELLLHTARTRGWNTRHNVHTDVLEFYVQAATKAKGKRIRDAGSLRPRRLEHEDERKLHKVFLAKGGAGIQHRAAFAWSLHALNRGDEWRSRLKLENFGISTAKANTSPDEMEIFSFCFDSSKTNTEGHIETIGAARHLDALLCPVSSFFMSMMWRFTPQLGGMTFPISVDMVESLKRDGYDFPWYGHPVYVNKYGKEMGYEGQRSFFKEVMAEAGVGKKVLQSKTTHLRTLGARQLDDHQCTTRYDVQAAGRWSQNRMDKHYLNDVSVSNVLAASGAPDSHSYCLPRGRITPPVELSRMIWPEMDAVVDAYSALPMEARDKDTAIAFFLEAMLRGRDILLQDCAVLMEELPSCALWRHPVFKHPMWKEFQQRILHVQATDDSLVKLEQANDMMELKMAVHGVAHSIMGKLDSLSTANSSKQQPMGQVVPSHGLCIKCKQVAVSPPLSEDHPGTTPEAPGAIASMPSQLRELPTLPQEFAVFSGPLELWEAYATGSDIHLSYKEAEEKTKKKWRDAETSERRKKIQQTWYKITTFVKLVEGHPQGPMDCLLKLARLLRNQPSWRLGTLLGKLPDKSWVDSAFAMLEQH